MDRRRRTDRGRASRTNWARSAWVAVQPGAVVSLYPVLLSACLRVGTCCSDQVNPQAGHAPTLALAVNQPGNDNLCSRPITRGSAAWACLEILIEIDCLPVINCPKAPGPFRCVCTCKLHHCTNQHYNCITPAMPELGCTTNDTCPC